jgi:hypothetical protein
MELKDATVLIVDDEPMLLRYSANGCRKKTAGC